MSKSQKLEKLSAPSVPFHPWNGTLVEGQVDQHTCGLISLLKEPWTKDSDSLRTLRWQWFWGHGWGIEVERLGVEKKWVLSQMRKSAFRSSSSYPNKEVLAEAPDKDLWPRAQRKKFRNEGTMDRTINMWEVMPAKLAKTLTAAPFRD